MNIVVQPDKSIVHKLRFVKPPTIYYDMINNAKKDFESKQEGVAIYSSLRYDTKTKKFISTHVNPNCIYPSPDCEKLKSIVVNHINAASKIGYYRIVPILINGEHGLGKTISMDYLVRGTKLSHIKRVDMTKYMNFDLQMEDILNTIYFENRIEGHTLIMVDEIDKYIAHKLNNEKCEDVASANATILNSVLTFIENDVGSKYVVFVVFCSNNFQTIYDNVDDTHYKSLQDRFIHYEFHRYTNVEFLQYLKYIHYKLNENINFDTAYAESIELYYNTLLSNFTVKPRKLAQFMLLNCYDINSALKHYNTEPIEEIYENIIITRPKKDIKHIESVNEIKSAVPIIPVKPILRSGGEILRNVSPVEISVDTNFLKNVGPAGGIRRDTKDTKDTKVDYAELFPDSPFENIAWEIYFTDPYEANGGPMTKYLLDNKYHLKNIMIGKKNISYGILDVLMYGIISDENRDIYLQYTQVILEDERNWKYLNKILNHNLETMANDVSAHKCFDNAAEIIFSIKNSFKYICQYDTGFVEEYITSDFNFTSAKRLTDYLEQGKSVKLVEYFKSTNRRFVNLSVDKLQISLETIIKSKYHTILHNRIPAHLKDIKTEDDYIKSLIHTILTTCKK